MLDQAKWEIRKHLFDSNHMQDGLTSFFDVFVTSKTSL